MTENEFDKNTWKNRTYWSQDYDGISEPKDEKEETTRNAETVRDALLCKPEEEWNQSTYGWHNADYTENQHAESWEHTDVDQPIDENIYQAMLEMDKKLKDGTYDPNEENS